MLLSADESVVTERLLRQRQRELPINMQEHKEQNQQDDRTMQGINVYAHGIVLYTSAPTIQLYNIIIQGTNVHLSLLVLLADE